MIDSIARERLRKNVSDKYLSKSFITSGEIQAVRVLRGGRLLFMCKTPFRAGARVQYSRK